MDELKAQDRLDVLRGALAMYKNMLNDPSSVFFGSPTIKEMIKNTKAEIYSIEECRHNMELDDSYKEGDL